MRKDNQTFTTLQHKLFYRFKYVDSNAILVPKFCYLPTCGNWVLGPSLLHHVANIPVVSAHFEQNFVFIAGMLIISFKIHSKSRTFRTFSM